MSGLTARSPEASTFVPQAASAATGSAADCPHSVTSPAPLFAHSAIHGAASTSEAAEPACRAVASSASLATAAIVAAQIAKTATSSNAQAMDDRADADERAVAERISKAGKQATPSAIDSITPASFQIAADAFAVASMLGAGASALA